MRGRLLLLVLLGACASHPPPRSEVALEAPSALPAPTPSASPAEELADAGVTAVFGIGALGDDDGGTSSAGEGLVVGGVGPLGAQPPHLGREDIRRVVRAHVGEMKDCYEKALAKHPDLAGRVTAKVVIDPSGNVSSAESTPQSTMPDGSVTTCVLAIVRRLRFPPPEGRGVTIVYPFVFQSAE